MAVESNRFSNFKCGDDRSLKLNGILAHGLPTVWLTVTALVVRHTSTAPTTAILTCHIIFRCMQLGDNRNKDLGCGERGRGGGGLAAKAQNVRTLYKGDRPGMIK